jgi:hypothetical protein
MHLRLPDHSWWCGVGEGNLRGHAPERGRAGLRQPGGDGVTLGIRRDVAEAHQRGSTLP